ncbi:hypothetical protein SAMN05892877_10928 [Rhizobium subbaraonis]|uniref:Uncharacterized protein n=1 Tax=Rhizobium subbaraonis TaxID=908946 RepID=A0A285UI75_9HYPH|nr:hypothetical protein [Rhizobium subbaraonis]SOC41614.1 hypothetical protein SAMN05892877_10928 [Rhizobium subbaraonis]
MNDGYRPPERTKELLFNMVPTIVWVTVAAVIMFTPGPSAYDRLRDFDGLVAGALAVFAAWVTIRQMRRDDRSNDIRNEKVLRAMLRSDMLRFERMYYPQSSELADHLERLKQLPLPALVDRNSVQAWLDQAVVLERILIEIFATLHQPNWRASLDLLGGFASAKHAELVEDAKTLSEERDHTARMARTYLKNGELNIWLSLQQRTKRSEELVAFCCNGLEAVLEELEILADLYQIERTRLKRP